MKNKTITIYELLGLIKDGKAPKKIIYNGFIYYFQHQDYKYLPDDFYLFSEEIKDITDILNDQVEILDETDDEFEDIEDIYEIDINLDNKLKFPGGNWTGRMIDRAFAFKINKLIRNQRKIIEQLKNNKKENE
jgi:hypothetical protein